jgi:hypothetical protein
MLTTRSLHPSPACLQRVLSRYGLHRPFRSNAIGAGGVDFVPDLSFAEYDALVGRPPDLLIVPYLSAWQHEDAAVVPWIRAHVGSETQAMNYPADGLGARGRIPVGVAMLFRILALGVLGVLLRFAIIRRRSVVRIVLVPSAIRDAFLPHTMRHSSMRSHSSS